MGVARCPGARLSQIAATAGLDTKPAHANAGTWCRGDPNQIATSRPGIRQTPTFFVNGKPDPLGGRVASSGGRPLPRKAEWKGQIRTMKSIF